MPDPTAALRHRPGDRRHRRQLRPLGAGQRRRARRRRQGPGRGDRRRAWSAGSPRSANRSARVLLITDLNSRIPVLVEKAACAPCWPATTPTCRGCSISTRGPIRRRPGRDVRPWPGVSARACRWAAWPSVGEAGIRVQPFADWRRLEFVRLVDYGLTGMHRDRLADPHMTGGPGRSPKPRVRRRHEDPVWQRLDKGPGARR